jgi:hypothetical protein
MSIESQAARENPFGAKKVTQAEVELFVNHRLQPLHRQVMVLTNALDTLYAYLAEVGVGGEKVTLAEITAFVQSKNAENAKKAAEKANGGMKMELVPPPDGVIETN